MLQQENQVLVIDDAPERRELIARVLVEEGFTVTALADGFSAIRLATRQSFSLALVAVDLPGALDGATTVRQIRARQPALRALFTGDAAQRPRRAALDCDDFIAAPFRRRDLLGCVFELLQRPDGPIGRVGRIRVG